LATPPNFARIKAEIEGRRQQEQDTLSGLRRQELAAAGFADGKASEQWLRQEAELAAIRQQFGVIYALLVKPEHIRQVEIDKGGQFNSQHEKLKALSREFFALKQRHAQGGTIAAGELKQQVTALTEEYRQRLK